MKKQKPHLILMALLLLASLLPMMSYAQFSTDVGVNGVSPTATVCDAGAVPLSVVLTNLDVSNPTNGTVSLSFSVNGGAAIAGPSVSLLAGETQVVALGTYDFYPGKNVISVTATYGDDAVLTNNNATSTTIVQFSGTYTVGSAMNFATLKSVIDTINTYGLCGATTLMMSNEVEMLSAPIVLTTTTTNATNTLTIRETTPGSPRTLVAYTGTSTNLDGIFTIAGTDYVTLRGLILMENPANITATTQMEWGIGLLKASATNGTQNTKINGVLVQLNKANTSSKGIYMANHTVASTTALTISSLDGANSNNTVDSSAITNVYVGIYTDGYNDATAPYTYYDQNNYLGKTYGNVITNFGGTSTQTYGIYARYQNNLTITKDSVNGGTGTTTTTDGIYIGTSNNANVNIVANRVILSSSATTSQVSGIRNSGGGGTVNNNNIVIQNNKIKVVCTTATTGTLYGIQNSGSPDSLFVSNNIISGLLHSGTGSLYGLDYGAPVVAKVNSNIIEKNKKTASGSVYFIRGGNTKYTITNNIVRYDTATTGSSSMYGISNSATPTYEYIENNQVYNLVHQGTGSLYGINTNTGASSKKYFYNNKIYNFSSTGGTGYGIAQSLGDTIYISGNAIYNISHGGTSGVVYGINIASGTTNIITNNFVSSLLAPAATGAQAVNGIYINSGSGTKSLVYYNTVYLDGTSSGTNFGGSALYASTAPTVELINNILVSNLTPTGTGLSVSYRRSGTALTSYSSNSNNNLFYAGTPGVGNLIFNDGTNSDQTISAYQTRVAFRDNASFTSVAPFVNISTIPYDLHIQTTVSTGVESGGKPISGLTVDIDGNTRNISTPDIGADEFNGIPSYTCSTPTPGNTVASSTSLCFGNGVSLSLQNATIGTGVTYKWQSSADGVAYSDISGAVSPIYSVTPTADTYYQCVVTCASGPVSATSTPVMVGFANSVTSYIPSSRCGIGSVSLAATGSAGTTINWYDASTGNNKVGTGSPWTTPSIAATTTYYASAEAASTVIGNVTIGTGTSTTSSTGYPTAFGNYYYQDWFQYVITAAELQATGLSAGNINSISFNISALPSPNTPPTDYQVSIGATSNSTLSAWQTTGLTVCFGPATPPALTVGWNTLIFTTPYNWDGTSNIIIDIRGTEKYGSANATTYYTTTTGNTLLYAYTSSSNTSFWTSNPTPTTSTSRLNTRLNGNITTICSSPRVPVTATIGSSPALTLTPNQTVCNNSVATLTVTSTLSDYDSYIWSPSANLFTDAACTTPYDGVSSATTIYAKTATAGTTTYTCTSNNSVTLCSNVITTDVTVTPASVTISSSAPTLCNSGSVSFTATPNTGYGTATFQWQNSSDNVTFNDIAGANTLTYTTPAISSTMYYKLLVKNDASTCFESNVATITVNNPQVLSTTPGNRCGTGTLALTATSTPGTDINWYDQSANGTKLGTGTSFTTPVISATTTYYVEAAYPVAAPATIGAGALTSSSYENPFYHLYGGQKNQYLIPASELVAAGLTGGQIKSIKFKVTAAGTTYQNFTLSMGTTSNSSLSAFVTGLTDVYFSAAGVTPTVGDYAIALATPFVWDGTSNLIVQTSWSNNNSGGTSTTVSYDNTAYTSGVYYRADNTSAAAIYASTTVTGTITKRPVMIFSLQECASNRVAVNANINTPPAINVTATPTTLCLGDASALNVNSTNAGYSYAWSTGTTPSTGTDVSVSPVTSSSFTVTATDNSGGTYDGCVALETVNITVNPKPTAVTASTNNSLVCLGNTVDLSSTADFTQHLIMENGDGGFENGSTFALNNWTVVNGSSNNWYVGSTAGVQSGTNAAFTGSSASSFTGTANSSVNHFYKDVVIPAGVQNISLSFYMLMPISDDTYDYLYVYTTNTANTPVAGTVPGTGYTNIFTYTSPAVSSYTIKTISLPDALAGSTVRFVFTYKSDAYSPYAVFAIDNISMLYETPGGTYSWASNPAGFTSNVQNPTGVTPTTNTQYTVTATNSYNCSNTASVSVNVDMPSVGGTATAAATQICAGTGTSVSLAGNLGIIQWQSSADGTTWTDVSGATTTTLNTGNLSDTTHFRAVVTNGLCGSAFSTVTTVNTLPQPTVTLTSSANPSICNGGSTTIDLTLTGTAPFIMVGNDGSGPATFPGLGATVNLPVSPTVNTTYTVVSVTDANNCVYSGGPAVSVTVNSPSVGGDVVAADNEICSGTGTNVTLSGNTGGIQWQSSSDNITFTDISGETNSILATGNLTAGTYYRAIVTSGVCNSAFSDTTLITVNALPSVSFTGTLADQCINNTSYALTGGLPAGGVYSGTGVTGTNFDASVAGVGTQTITYTYTDGTTGCINSTTNTIDVNALPSVTFAGTLADQCVNNTTYTLTGGTPAGGVYSGTGVTGTNFDASVAGVGTQTITYTYTDGTTGCINSTTNTIDVNALPSVTFAGTLADQCANNTTYTLTGGTPSGGVYSGTGVTGTNFDASVAGVGTEIITYSYTDGTTGCASSATNTVDVIAVPATPVVTYDNTGGITVLTSSTSAGNQWYNTSGIISGETNATYTVTENGSYYVQVTVNGCTSANSNTIVVDWITGIVSSESLHFNIYPNPSSDRVSIESDVIMTAYSLYDETGKLIETRNVSTDKLVIAVANLNSGVYYIRIQTSEGWFIQPVQVQNK